MNRVDKIETSKQNVDIYNTYVEASGYLVSLRSMVTMGTPGNKRATFRAFKRAFDMLHLLTFATRGIDKEIVDNVKTWIDEPHITNRTNILNGLKLYEKYIKHLIEQEVISHA